MVLSVGQTLSSQVDSTTVIVIRARDAELVLTCGGEPMVDDPASPAPTGIPVPPGSAGTLLGKRYEDSQGRIEVLCTKAGASLLAVDGLPLSIKAAKALPASD
jgi:hypothetical protein